MCFPLLCYHTNLLILHCLLVFRWLQYIQHLWQIQPVQQQQQQHVIS